MPFRYGKDSRGRYVKWGTSGKKYHYTKGDRNSRAGAKSRAERQRKAIKARGG